MCTQTSGGNWGPAAPQPTWDAGQLAREQAQRLYNQQLQRQPQQQSQQRSVAHDLAGKPYAVLSVP